MANAVAITGNLISAMNITEVFTPNADASAKTLILDSMNENITLTGSTSPASTKGSIFTVTLSGGAATLDLTAIPGLTPNETIDGTGLKVQFIKFTPTSSNANPITVSKGASNGYGMTAAGTTWSIPMDAGQSETKQLNASSITIDATHKNIDFAGTAAQTIKVAIVLG